MPEPRDLQALLEGLPDHRITTDYDAATGGLRWRCVDCGGAMGPPVHGNEDSARAAHDERALRARARWIEVDGHGGWKILDAPIGIDEQPRVLRSGHAAFAADAVEQAKGELRRLQQLECDIERRDIRVYGWTGGALPAGHSQPLVPVMQVDS